jgi:hypothetical protein
MIAGAVGARGRKCFRSPDPGTITCKVRRKCVIALLALTLVAAATAVALAGDSGRSGEPSAGLRSAAARSDRGVPGPGAVRDCASRVEGRRLRAVRRHDLIAGPVVFHGFRQYSRIARRNPSEAFRSRNGEYRPLKMVTDVRAGAVVTVAIAPADRQRAALFYRTPFPAGRRAFGFRLDEGQAVVRFESCSANQPRFSGRGVVGGRTQFNGGFVFTEPQCLRLDFYYRSRTRPVRYVEPFGRAPRACWRRQDDPVMSPRPGSRRQ